MNKHMEAAIKEGNFENIGGDYLTTERVIRAALPHIRAMIAQEVLEGFSPETGGEDLPLYEITAQIAEETAMRERRAWDEGFAAGWEEAKEHGTRASQRMGRSQRPRSLC